MDQVKLFGCNTVEKLEVKINEFLATNPGEVLDLRVEKLYDPDRKTTCFSALVWYEKSKPRTKAGKTAPGKH
ncbi:MAG: hypothetical protein HGA76_05735 [Candidatus Firestonebacteria bacterium]|nr:hypothetical protein [Candidatus Firestonebacteria bacterium]